MTHFNTVLANALRRIIIDGKISRPFYLVVTVLATFQTISVIAYPETDLFEAVKWFNPGNQQDAAVVMVTGLSFSLTFITVLVLRLIFSNQSQEVRPTTFVRYLGTILLYLQTISKTIVLIPFLKACLYLIKSPPNSTMLALSVLTLFIYLFVLLSSLIYNSSNTFILTPQINRKLNYWNAYVWMSLFRVLFVFGNVLNNSSMPILCGFFFFVYICLIVKWPIFAYTDEKIKKALLSVIGYTSFVRMLSAITGDNNSVLVQILGMASFAALIEWISAIRIKKILQREQPSIFQFKILFFMVGNLEEHLKNLEYFILNHHQKCNNLACLCTSVVSHLSAKNTNLKDDKIWYRFLQSFAKFHYCLQEIKKLPESQLLAKIEKYQYIVIDLVEISLFKLDKLNEAYYTLGNLENLLQQRQIFSLVFQQKKEVMKFFLEETIRKKYKADELTNQYADKYMNFQIQFENYCKLLLKASNKAAQLWEEMNKRQPYQQKLLQDIKTLQVWNQHIRILYYRIVQQFQKADRVLEEITNDYFEMVLNVSQRSSFHVIPIPRFQGQPIKKKQRIEPLSQNMQSFSFDSQTPMCFVSVSKEERGKIKNFNCYFSEIMKLQYGKFVSIQEFIIPEMREFHSIKMQEFVNGDFLSRQHNKGFTINSKGKLLYTKILVQIVPSISEGLQYMVFFKKIMKQKKIFSIKNMHEIVYQSQSFENFIEQFFQNQSMMSYITSQIYQQLKTNQKADLTLSEGDFELKLMHEYNQKDANYLFLQIINKNQFKFGSNSTNKTIKGQKSLKKRFSNKDQIVQAGDKSYSEIEELIVKSIEHFDMDQKEIIQKQKKTQEKIIQTYEIILNRNERQFSSSMSCCIISFAMISIILFLAIIVIKYENQSDYFAASDVHYKYNQFMLLISRYSLKFRQINLSMYQNTSTVAAGYMFKSLQTQPLIGPTMDSFLYMFDIPAVSQTWTTFSVTNNTIVAATQNNFLAVADSLINPISNLNNSNVSSLNFPFAIQYLPNSSPPISTHFYQLIINTLYSHLPNFRILKQSKMNPIIAKTLDNFYSILIVNFLLLVTMSCWLIWALSKHKNLAKLKFASYQILQKMKGGLIKQKWMSCTLFHNKYSYIQTQAIFEDKLKRIEGDKFDKIMKDNASFDSEEEKDNDIRSSSGSVRQSIKLQTQQKRNNQKDNNQNCKDRNFQIFKEVSFLKTVFKYTFPYVPLMVFLIAFTTFEFNQNQKLKHILMVQENIQNMQQNTVSIRLYAMQYGVYNPSLEKYLSIPARLQRLIGQMFAYERLCVNSALYLNLPQLQDYVHQIYYGNICELQQQGFFSQSNYSFYGKGNLSNCLSINNQMLTKGFISSVLHYVESVSSLIYSNPKANLYNSTQKLAYLNSPFFTDVSKLAEYFDLIFDTALRILIADYTRLVQRYTSNITASCGFFIAWFIIIVLFLRKYYLDIVKWDVLEIHSIFSLISYESLVKNDYLKAGFVEKIEDFNLLD